MTDHIHVRTQYFLLALALMALIALSACSRPAGEAGPEGIEPLAPVAPEAPVPEADEQPDPNVVLTAEAGAESDFLIGVGVVQFLEDEETLYMQSLFQGVRLAINQINEANFLGDERQMALAIGDTLVTDAAAVTDYEEPLSLQDTLAVVGPVLQRGDGGSGGEAAAVPLVLLPQTGTGVFGEGQYVDNWTLRAGLPSGDLSLQTVRAVAERVGLTDLFLVYDASTATDLNLLVEELESEGVNITSTAVEEGTTAADLVLLMQEADPDAVLLETSVETAAEILIEAHEDLLAEETRFIAGAGLFNPQLLERAGEAATGLIGGTAWYIVEPFDATPTFDDAFQETYGTEPDPVATRAYTAVWLLAEAVRIADSAEPAAVRDALETIDEFETPLGAFVFEGSEDPLSTPITLEVRDAGEIAVFE